MEITFLPIAKQDLPEVTRIYNYYVENSTATFHLEPVTEQEMEASLNLGSAQYPSFSILKENNVIGFCYLGQFRKKEAYDITAELTLYLSPTATQKGVGKLVLDFLEIKAKALSIKNLIGVITAENENSIKLFERCGYFKAAHLQGVGIKFNRELDVIWYQKKL